MKNQLFLMAGLCLTLLPCVAGCSGPSAETTVSDDSHILNIYCWNNEFKSRIEAYYPDYDISTHTIGSTRVNWIIIPNENNAYQHAVDEALLNQSTAADNDKVDLFLIEADNVAKYTRDDSPALTMEELGITESDMSEQFQYTRDAVTDNDGNQRGISWQACPGVMIYRRDIARQIFGDDAPSSVQSHVSNWDTFSETANLMQQQGVQMLAGYDDTYRLFASNTSQPWVDSSNKLHIDDTLKEWVTQTYTYTQAGYNNTYSLWSKDWGACSRGNTFCYFGPAWFFDYTLANYSLETAINDGGKYAVGNGSYGQWAVCEGPVPYYWGGSWICGAKGSDDTALIADIMRTLCCNTDTAIALATDVNDFANNRSAMLSLANDADYGSAFLGGQNMYGVLCACAEKIEMNNITSYDQGLNESFQDQYHAYFAGEIDEKTAYDQFIESILKKYPELTVAQ